MSTTAGDEGREIDLFGSWPKVRIEVAPPVFNSAEVDIMRDMFSEAWDTIRHDPGLYDAIDRNAIETLYNKLVKLGAV